MNKNIFWVGILIAIVIAVGGYFFPGGKIVQVVQDVVGAVGTRFPNGITIGGSGSDNVEVRSATCNVTVSASWLPITASSTFTGSCAITGVVSGDQVWASLPFINPIIAGRQNAGNVEQIFLLGAQASTTAGQVDFLFKNGGNAATSSIAQATTSVQVLFFDTSR